MVLIAGQSTSAQLLTQSDGPQREHMNYCCAEITRYIFKIQATKDKAPLFVLRPLMDRGKLELAFHANRNSS